MKGVWALPLRQGGELVHLQEQNFYCSTMKDVSWIGLETRLGCPLLDLDGSLVVRLGHGPQDQGQAEK